MPWRRFAVWNAAGSTTWAVLVGGLAYTAGAAGAQWLAVPVRRPASSRSPTSH
jgi:membrane protein DedA with SNARE-associated domain